MFHFDVNEAIDKASNLANSKLLVVCCSSFSFSLLKQSVKNCSAAIDSFLKTKGLILLCIKSAEDLANLKLILSPDLQKTIPQSNKTSFILLDVTQSGKDEILAHQETNEQTLLPVLSQLGFTQTSLATSPSTSNNNTSVRLSIHTNAKRISLKVLSSTTLREVFALTRKQLPASHPTSFKLKSVFNNVTFQEDQHYDLTMSELELIPSARYSILQ